jgi:hypothetical protein
MKNLKKLLAVVIAVTVLLTAMVPALAAESFTYEAEAQILNDLGLYAGTSTTEFNAALGSNLKREDGVLLLEKALGVYDDAKAMTDEDVATELAKFSDAGKIPAYAKKAVAYAAKNSLVLGYDGKFGAGDKMPGKQVATILLKKLGYVTPTDFGYATAVDKLAELAGADLETTISNATNRDAAVAILFTALSAKAKGKTTTVIADLVASKDVALQAAIDSGLYTEDAVKVTSVAGAGVKKLVVKFNTAVADTTKMVMTVKRDNVNVNIASTAWNEAKTEATLTASYTLQTGKYVVSAKYDTAAATTAEANVDAAKISKITFASDKGIMADGSVAGVDKKALRTTVKFENQYGENVTDNITLSDVAVTSSKGAVYSLNKGTMVLEDATDYAVDAKVAVTVVHKATATVATATLTVAQTAEVASIEFGALTTDNSDLKGKEVYVSTTISGNYYLPMIVKDQYGNELGLADVQAAVTTKLSSNNNIVQTGNTVTKNDKPALELADGAATETSGKAVITVVSTNGKTATFTMEVKENTKIDTLLLDVPSTPLKKTKEATIPFTATNQYGTALVSKSDLVVDAVYTTTTKLQFVDGTQISITGGTITYSIDYANSNALQIKAIPSADKLVFTVITASTKVQNITMNVEAAPTPTAISGLKSDFKTAIQKTLTSGLDTGEVVLKDQYGDDISLPAGWSIEVVANDGTFNAVTVPDANALTTTNTAKVFTAAVKGSEVVKLTLKDNSATPVVIDEYTYTMETVELADITSFGIDDLSKLYTGTDGTMYASHKVTFEIYGLKGTTKVVVDQSLMAAQSSTLATTKATVTSGAITVTVEVGTDGADKTAKLTVVVAANDGPVTIQKDLVYNSGAPTPAKFIVRDSGDSEVTAPAKQIAIADVNGKIVATTTHSAGIYFYAEDQYGKGIDASTFVITNVSDAAVVAGSAFGATVAANGTITLTNAAAGDSFQISAVTTNGMTKSIKVFLGN